MSNNKISEGLRKMSGYASQAMPDDIDIVEPPHPEPQFDTISHQYAYLCFRDHPDLGTALDSAAPIRACIITVDPDAFETVVKNAFAGHNARRMFRSAERQSLYCVVDSERHQRQVERSDLYSTLLYHRAFAIASSPDHLPGDILLHADSVVDLREIDPTRLREAIRSLTGVEVPVEDAAEIAGYPLELISIAYRHGRTAENSIFRLRAACAEPERKANMSAGKGPALEDLTGFGAAADWGHELAIDLEDWKTDKIQWSEVDRGILLSGVPGTGKTTFAAALARTCGAHFVAGSFAKWQSAGHLGQMLKAMRDAFQEAREYAPSILFIDEIDSAGDRRHFTGDNAQYCIEALNGLLECIDGSGSREGIVIVGATNYPDNLDDALTRPGRLDRHIEIPLPDAIGREGILRYHLGGEITDRDLSPVVFRTGGQSGAHLEQLVRGAKRIARRARRPMTLEDLMAQLPPQTRISVGRRYRASFHEAGHAIVGLTLECKIEEIVVSRLTGGPLGYVCFLDQREKDFMTDADYEAIMVRLLAGMAAEEIILGTRSDGSGAEDGSDLHGATLTAALIEASTGLGEALTYLSSADPDEVMRELRLNPRLQQRVDQRLARAYATVKAIVTERRAAIEKLASAVYDRERMSGDEINELLDQQTNHQLNT